MSEQAGVEHTWAEGFGDVGPLDLRVVGVLAAAKLIMQMAGAWGYGYFRDELYFLDCARHPTSATWTAPRSWRCTRSSPCSWEGRCRSSA